MYNANAFLLRDNNNNNNIALFNHGILSLQSGLLKLHITTDEEAAASKRMVFYDFYVFQRKKTIFIKSSKEPCILNLV